MSYVPCGKGYPSICTLPTSITLKTDTRLIFTSGNISTPAIQFRWVPHASSTDVAKSDSQGRLYSRGGFRLKWQLVNSANCNETTKIKETISVWKIKSRRERNLTMMAVMNLVRQGKIQKASESKVWKTLLKHRWDSTILKTNPCLNESQVAEVIYKTGQDLKIKYDWNLWIPDEDPSLGNRQQSCQRCLNPSSPTRT